MTAVCEWGLHALEALNADVVVVVDVLSFSTAVQVATSRGVTVYPARTRDDAARPDAILAGKRSHTEPSLSPASLARMKAGTRLVLPSPNGATISVSAKGHVLAGCLRNAEAVARAAQKLGERIAVIPAGERWPDGSLRPALEDWLGAGAILSYLPNRSPEAQAAVDAFLAAQDRLPELLLTIPSGLELIERGFEDDVRFAAQLNASDTIPRLLDGAYVSWSSSSERLYSERLVERSAVRALVVADDHLLLMQMAFPWREGTTWITPGGGVDDGEDLSTALQRELREELCRDDLSIGEQLWQHTSESERGDFRFRQSEGYFLVRTARFEPQTTHFTPFEREWFRGFRWWPIAEIAEAKLVGGRVLNEILEAL